MNFKHLNNISLKWKLVIPFLFLAAMGAATLFLVSYRFQSRLIHVDEEQRLRNLYQGFLNDIELKKNMALSLAYLTSGNPEVAAALARRDRSRLLAFSAPAFKILSQDFGVQQFHYHIPPAVSFLRVHAPGRYGDDLSGQRPTINRARETAMGVGGIETGLTGLSIRGVAPVFHQGKQVGTVEIGLSLGQLLLEEFKKKYQVDIDLFLPEKKRKDRPRIFASTQTPSLTSADSFLRLLRSAEIRVSPESLGNRKIAVIRGPLKDFSGQIIGLVKISVDRGPTLALLQRYAWVTAGLGLAGLLLSIAFVWFVAVLFTRRINEVVKGAEEVAAGRRNFRLPEKSGDELDVMARAINQMLRSLDASQLRLKEYAQNLEMMVEQRTRSLKESERTYRTLVENVPMIVYMLKADGQTMFLNRATEQMIGLPPQQLNGTFEQWAAYIHPEDRPRVTALRKKSLEEKQEMHTEYRLIHQNGGVIYCFDHAVPVPSETRDFFRLDGIIIDVTAQKELQEKNLQAQELETLGQISSRLAHELRNPLTSIGGLARRIAKSFDTDNTRAEKSRMIVEEVQKLEKILNMMLTFISPQAVNLQPRPFNPLVLKIIEMQKKKNPPQVLTINLDPDLGLVPLDEVLLGKALLNLLENTWERMDRSGTLEVTTHKNTETAILRLTFPVSAFSREDMDHYFFPFALDVFAEKHLNESDLPDVSLSKVIIHKHSGKIQVSQEENHRIRLTITLPLVAP
ncbi:MAG: cache domain-containing protein [Thermodesulfobacteriota bacterium]